MPKLTRLKAAAFLLTCALGLCSSGALSDETNAPMPTFSVSYILENDFVTAGEAIFRLSKKADHHQLLLETKPTGIFQFSKQGKIREIAELPSANPPFLSTKYSYTNFGDQDRSYTSIYNRQTGETTVARGENTTSLTMDVGVLDRLSMILAIMQQLRENPAIKNFSINSADNNGVDTFSFVSRGQAQLKTKIGTLTTTRIDRQRSNSNRNTITWFAAIGPDAIPLPVQIEQYKRDKLVVRLKISQFSSE